MYPNQLAEALLLAIKKSEDSASFRNQLAGLPYDTLRDRISTDAQKKAFWINIYNAYFQFLHMEGHSRPIIFRNKLITIAERQHSLDDIEHGILRRYRHKYALGFLPKLFPSKTIRQLAVRKPDYRIHFALNCGAQSCPPIATYNQEHIDSQLQFATESFIEQDSKIDHHRKVLCVSQLFKWYYRDFGGSSGIIRIHESFFQCALSSYRIRYNPYSWEEQLHNFTTV